MIRTSLHFAQHPVPTSILLAAVVGFTAARDARAQGASSPVPRQQGPFAGMDRNGRIPKVKLPDGIKHPERWRYFPEGRLVEGSLLDRFLISSFFSPILFREEDVGTGGGVAITDVDFRNQRRQEFANIVLTYSSEGQQTYRMNWRRWTNHIELPDGGVLQDERSFVHFNGGYSKSLTSRFFGFGSDRPESAESSYTRELSALELYYQFTDPQPADDFIIHTGIEIQHNNLARGRVSTVPSTDTAYRSPFVTGDDHDILYLDLRARYDTRDSQHNPYSGWHFGIATRNAILQSGGDVGSVLTASSSKIFQMPPLFHNGGDSEEEHPPNDSLAFGGFASFATGDLPFYALPSLGGSRTLRGYVNNRFTDRAAWHASAEYRFWFVPRGVSLTDHVRVERIGAALFYDIGNVAPTFDAFFDDKPKYSYGVSLRFSLERTALFRFDYGISNEDSLLSIAYGLTF